MAALDSSSASDKKLDGLPSIIREVAEYPPSVKASMMKVITLLHENEENLGEIMELLEEEQQIYQRLIKSNEEKQAEL